jgi:uncharacterized membrane protein
MSLSLFVRAENGGVSILTALSGIALIGFVGLATDVGAVYLQARRLQGTADLAAIAAASQPSSGQDAARAVLRANNWPEGTQARVTPGSYVADRNIAPDRRFTPNAGPTNAVNVELTTQAPLYFARLFVPDGHMTVRRRATAAQSRLVSFQIGSRLLSLNGGVANQALSALTGSTVNLSVMDYNALLSADVDLLSYVDALRTRMDLEAASFDHTMQARTDAPEALQALADVLGESDLRAESAMRRLASATTTRSIDSLSEVLDIGPYASQDTVLSSDRSRISVNAMDLAAALLEVAGGARQVRLATNANIPGLSSVNIWLAIGERPNHSPWLSVTEDFDVIIRTAQTRLYIEANVQPGGALGVANVRVPLLVEAAAAQARVSDASCSANGEDYTATLAVAPSVGSVSLGQINTADLDNFTRELRPARAELVRVGPARVEGQSRIELGGLAWQSVRFTDADIEAGRVKTVQTRDIAQATLTTLLAQTTLSVRVVGLGVTVPGLAAVTKNAITPLGAPLDNLVNGLSDLLGVHLGEADVRVNGVRCGGAALVG